MDVFVSIDMEGVAGVAHGEQVRRGSDDYPACRHLMEQEANAAVEGAFAAGAQRVVVNDAHGDMRNLRPAEMDSRAELLIGSPKVPYGMMQGISANFGVALFIGYHARAGTAAAVLDHSYSGAVVLDIRVNGASWGEAQLNAALAGSYGVPVGLVTGDDKVCAQVEEIPGGIKTLAVKQAFSRGSALSAHPVRARQAIAEAANEVVTTARTAGLEPFHPPGPLYLEVDVVTSGMADMASMVPGAVRTAPRTVTFEALDVETLVRARMAITAVAATAA